MCHTSSIVVCACEHVGVQRGKAKQKAEHTSRQHNKGLHRDKALYPHSSDRTNSLPPCPHTLSSTPKPAPTCLTAVLMVLPDAAAGAAPFFTCLVADLREGVAGRDDIAADTVGVPARTLPVEDAAAPARTLPVEDAAAAVCTLPVPPRRLGVAARAAAGVAERAGSGDAAAAGLFFGCRNSRDRQMQVVQQMEAPATGGAANEQDEHEVLAWLDVRKQASERHTASTQHVLAT